LVYPVVTMKAPIAHAGSVKALFDGHDEPALLQTQCVEDHVQDGSPPTILFHASDDTSVPVDNTLMLYNALRAHSVAAELHIFAEGGHGFGLRAIQGKPVAAWPDLFAQWAKRQGMWR
jgi:acetyl esterase/lipase